MLPPSLLTGARFAAVPLLLFGGASEWRLPVFLVACATDLLDGMVARRLGSETRLGSKLDALADFLLVATVSSFLTLEGLLSPIFVALIVFAFTQFLVAKPRKGADPLGKHIGTILFVVLGVILAVPAGWVALWSSLLASGYILVSLAARWL
ncbi:MAG: CDP-alcohol phosphatidyltransferase family protein [Candidatus Bathyarchaeota archaeon]|nr:CDP-alcohol phosphatidyltransferase family protein [Candidatus Bathyarchaeota archaeon]